MRSDTRFLTQMTKHSAAEPVVIFVPTACRFDALRAEIDRASALPEFHTREVAAVGQQRLRTIERLLVGRTGEFLDIGDAAVGVEEISAIPAHDAIPSLNAAG